MAVTRDIRTRYLGEDRTGPATRSVRRNVDTIGNSYDRLQRQISRTNRLIAGITLGAGGTNALRTMANLQNSTARLSGVTKTLAADQQFIAKTANRMSLEIESATSAMARLRVLEDAGALQQSQSKDFLIGLADAYAFFGASVGQQENVLYGLAQAMSQGTTQAQELNQVVEPLPGFLNQIARGAGKTAGEYRELVKSGTQLSSTFRDDVLKAFEQTEGAAERLRGNIQQTLVRLSNDYKNALVQFQTPVGNALNGLSDALGGALRILGNNAKGITTTISTLLTVFAASLVGKGLRSLNDFTKGLTDSSKKRIAVLNAESAAYAQKGVNDAKVLAVSRKIATEEAKITAQKAVDSNREIVQAKVEEKANLKILATKKAAAAQEKLILAEKAVLRTANRAGLQAELVAEQKLLLAKQAQAKADLQAGGIPTGFRGRASYLKTLADEQGRIDATNKRLAVSTSALAKAEQAAAAASARAVTAAEKVNVVKAQQEAINKQINAGRIQDVVLQNQIAAASVAQAKSIADVQRRSQGVLDAQKKLGVGTRALNNLIAVQTTAMRGLSGLYNLIGGGFGVAALAAFGVYKVYRALRDQGPAVEAAQDRIGLLKAEYEDLADGAKLVNGEIKTLSDQIKDEITNATNFAERVASLNAGLTDLFSLGEGNALTRALSDISARLNPLTSTATLAGDAIGYITRQKIAEAEATQKQLEAEERLALVRDGNLNIAGVSAEEKRIAILAGADQAEKANLGNKEKIAAVNKQILQLENGIKAVQATSPERAKEYQAAIGLARKELNEITGVTKAREKHIELIKKQKKAQTEVIESLETERQRIAREFGEQVITLKASLELQEGGTPLLSQGQFSAAVIDLAKAREAKLSEIEKEAADKRLQALQDSTQRQMDVIRAQAERRQSLADEVANAQAVVNPVAAIDAEFKAKVDALNERARFEIEIRRNLSVLVGAAEIKHAEERAAAVAQAEAKIQAELAKRRAVQNVNVAGNALNAFLDYARPAIGQYIQITKTMTDAEKKAAEASNAINARKLKKDKKIRRAQAIIDMYAGANAALATGGFAGIGQALAIIAFGATNLKHIDNETFGSGGRPTSGGSNSYTDEQIRNSNGEGRTQGTSTTQMIVIAPQGSDPTQVASVANTGLAFLKKASDSQQISVNTDRQIQVSDIQYLEN